MTTNRASAASFFGSETATSNSGSGALGNRGHDRLVWIDSTTATSRDHITTPRFARASTEPSAVPNVPAPTMPTVSALLTCSLSRSAFGLTRNVRGPVHVVVEQLHIRNVKCIAALVDDRTGVKRRQALDRIGDLGVA